MKTSDKELLGAIADQDKYAFNEFYLRYSRLLYEWAYNRTGNTETTNEITQCFWEGFWLNPTLIKTNEEGCSKNFLLRFFTFRMLDYLKTKQAESLSKSGKEIFLFENNESLAYSHVFEELEAKEIHKILDEILNNQPETTRRVFHLRWEQNYSVAETAAQLQLKEKDIYNRYHRLLSLIRSQLTLIYSNSSGVNQQMNRNQ